jgi:hypothetical protein
MATMSTNYGVELENLPGLLIYNTGKVVYKVTKQPKKTGIVRGYKYISVGKRKFYIHKLVATAFVPNPENKKVVIHIDGDLLNNHYKNLAWASRIEAQIYSYKVNGREPKFRILSEREKEFIVQQLEKGIPGSILAKQFKVSEMKISRIKQGKKVL